MNSLQKMISNTSTSIETAEKTCPLCQKKFIPKGRQKYCDGPHFKPCPVCGKLMPAPYPSDPPKCCSKECRQIFKGKSVDSASNQVKDVKKDLAVSQIPAPVVIDKEYSLDPELQLTSEPLKILEKGSKEFFTKMCIFESKIPGLIKNHVYDIQVVKHSYTYEVTLTYDHTYRKDINILFDMASALSFNTYFK